MATVQLAKKYAMEQSIKNVLAKQTVSHQQQQVNRQGLKLESFSDFTIPQPTG